MQYLVCQNCGYINEPIDKTCNRCQSSLEGLEPQTAEQAAVSSKQHNWGQERNWGQDAATAASSAVSYVTSNLKPLSGEYPYAHRYINWLRTAATWSYILSLVALAALVLVMLGGAFQALGARGGVGDRMLLVVGQFVGAALVGVVGFFIARFNYMLLMALPDFLTCFLRIENNTRVQRS